MISQDQFVEKRESERLPVNLQARLFFGNMVYTARVTNLSESGMFICTQMTFPSNVLLIAALKAGDYTYKLPVKINRTVKPGNHPLCLEDIGMGVRLINPSKEYLDFVAQTKASQ
jgi:hypothetical protein